MGQLEAVPLGYEPRDERSLPRYLATLPVVPGILGGSHDQWRVREVGDGNLNLVFIVEGPNGGVAVKQALPYVRLVGESWPLPLSRAYFEALALAEQQTHAPGLVPQVCYHDEEQALIVMELLQPHIIMRRGMIDAQVYPRFADDLSTFMARSLFYTSDLALTAAEKKAKVAVFCGNTALCKITEDLIFTEPYMVAENNRWTSPQLDEDARAVREDGALKVAISELKLKFLTETQALLHGDLHTGSVMVTPEDTRIIDPEFAFYGPMGFDIGAVIANLILNYVSQDGHATATSPREDYKRWVLEQVALCWDGFESKFRALWTEHQTGDAYPRTLVNVDGGNLHLAQDAYMARLLEDSIGFAAAKMIRRILGLAHNIDLEWIEDPDRRAACERRALHLARKMMLERSEFGSIGALVDIAISN